MSEHQENSSKFRSSSSSENRDSVDSLKAEFVGGDEEFYEKIEAPKFVDFTVPDHYRPDDRYWFCLRVGCDQKHEEEIDSEEIYKNFVLRVMAARSPNVRLRKALDRNASRTPTKCPLSAPPKSSRPRLARMAIISSFSKKMVDDKKRVVKPLLRSGCTPVTKTKPVAAKYLTTPRNKKSISEQNSFRSVQNPKPVNVEVEKGRMVAKALVFHSPKKAIKVKTSVELKTPISKLCQGMKKLEIASQRKHHLVSSSKSSKNLSSSSLRKQLSSRKVQRKPEVPRHSQTCNNKEAKSGKSIETKIKGQLLQQQASMKLVGSDEPSTNSESCDIQHQVNVAEELFGLQESVREESCMSSIVPLSTHDLDSASPDDSKKDNCCLDVEECNSTISEATNTQENSSSLQPTNREENNSKDRNEIINSSEGERNGHEFMDSDDKENASASDGNRIHNNNLEQNGRKIFGLHEKFQKKVTQQAPNKNLKEGFSGPVMKLKKPKPTNPKPFRLRTDERGILKEATLEKRTNPQTPRSEGANLSTTGGKLQRKQRNDNDIQKVNTIIGLKTPKGQERSKAAALVKPESKKHQEPKLISNAMQRLEKFRKITSSPLPKHTVRPQGLVSTKLETISYLIPGQKLDVIPEASPEVFSEPREGKPTRNAPTSDDAASRSSSRGRRPVTVAMEPNFHSTHVPRSCIKNLK